MALELASYHCEACATSFCPRDNALGPQDTSLSAATPRMVGLAAAMVSFAESRDQTGGDTSPYKESATEER